MLRTLLLALPIALLPAMAAAQSIEGNWECRAGDVTGGLLTIYGNSYIFAGATFGDPASGGGSVNWDAGGPQFIDGNLVTIAGVSFGQMISGGGVVPMDLIGGDTVRLTCFKRLDTTTYDLPLEGIPSGVAGTVPDGAFPLEPAPTAPPVAPIPLSRPPGL
jgi:hypothetical protein